MKVCFTGDLFLGGDLLNKNVEGIIQSENFHSADVRIVNLEQPISDSKYVEDKSTLYTGSYAIKQLKALNIDAVNLAHNHIQDKGLDGINETINHLNQAGIGYFGAGKNIDEAKKPYWITDNIALFGYCDFDKPYLKQVEVAGASKPGVNPLRINSILHDLDTLKGNQKAILQFHWGREHVWLPPYENISLAKNLLKDDRVLMIVGMHAHRSQGYIKQNGKRAYMCLGNFLFPNFYIQPPTQICYPKVIPVKYDITRQYHSVYNLTYKKWRRANRISTVLIYNVNAETVNHYLVIQDDNKPVIKDLADMGNLFYLFFIELMSCIYRLPKIIYHPIEWVDSLISQVIWRTQIYWFKIKQLGFINSFKKALNKL